MTYEQRKIPYNDMNKVYNIETWITEAQITSVKESKRVSFINATLDDGTFQRNSFSRIVNVLLEDNQ